MLAFPRHRRILLLEAGLYPLFILLVNLLIVAREFSVDYSAYLDSNEGSFIAIARSVASHPGDLLWWPLWDLGLPLQSTYIPGLHILVGAFSRLTGQSAGLSYHQVCAVFFALGPVAMYFMAWIMTDLPGTSWFAALAYSLVSPTAWLMPAIRGDIGGAWNLRRLQILAYYGEGPHIASLFFVPLAVLFLWLALTKCRPWMNIAAGLFFGLAILMNAFAAVILAIAALVLIVVSPGNRVFLSAGRVFVVALLAYLWISPLLPPSVAANIRSNSLREYPFNAVSALGLANLSFSCMFLWLITKERVSEPVRIFLLFTLSISSVVLLAYYGKCNIVPQPHRYSPTMDMGLCLSAVFGGAAVLNKLAKPLVRPLSIILVVAAIIQTRHDRNYAQTVIRRADVTATTTYHLAQWMNDHMEGQRVFVGGVHSFHLNAFTDTPQVRGGHDPMQPSMISMIGGFVIASGMNTGSRYLEICSVWLKALGAHAFAVPGPLSDYYTGFIYAEKFENHFPVLWREGDVTIYGVPLRSTSLAHVVPAESLVQRFPINGLDIGEMTRYVAALEDSSLPHASFQWLNWHAANIQSRLEAGQVISIQERYMPGWTAAVNGLPQKIERDGLGFMVIRPACNDCRVTISYGGGPEWLVTCAASLLVMLLSGFTVVRSLLPRTRAGCTMIPGDHSH